jgi:hypothetical protein
MSQFIGYLDKMPPEKVPPWGEIMREIVELEACFKNHTSFSNEREFRLATKGTAGQADLVQFRTVRSTLVPYIPLYVPGYKPGNADLPKLGDRHHFIDRVVVGPTSNMELSRQSVEYFFRKLGMKVGVEPSQIPFRDW